MPVIACPGCGKKYKLPESAAGQVAKCACGKRFRLGAPPSAALATTKAASAVAPKKSAPKPAATAATKSANVAVAPAAIATDDDFWDEGLKPTPTPKVETPPPAPVARQADKKQAGKPKKKAKAEKRVAWGFDWGKVAGGMLTFLAAGGFALFIFLGTGRISIYLPIIAAGGLFTALSGLMGEEGIW